MANILVVHQNYPGQYREIVPRLIRSGGNKVSFLTQRRDVTAPEDHFVGVYKSSHIPAATAWKYSTWYETALGNAVGAARACKLLKDNGFVPDIVTGHANWGELIFIQDIWPNVPIIGYFEYYFIAEGGLVGYDPEFREPPDMAPRLFANNAPTYLTYERCIAGISPTQWQKDTHPPSLQGKLNVIHDGIRTDRLIPDHHSDTKIEIGDTTFARGEEIVTYIARNLEPARGFHVMMRALPRLQSLRPNARVAIIGGDGVSYGSKLPAGQTFRARLVAELGDRVDWSKVHFLGQIPYRDLMALIRLANCHIYLTAPFVLSWSLLEAMALQKTVVATNVAPVREVITHGSTGFLIDYFKPEDLAEQVADVLAHHDNYRSVGVAARELVVRDYDFHHSRFPRWAALFNNFLPDSKKIDI
ncbi:glycosyltransferase [Pararhizobium gei]|uniref:glycosyltransferase n=1 Tax=Pararhizobium gei TaxID=1395951 RepID=UPI0023DA041E|nr:glycosyltransferase [Rhizobium gei]